MTTKITKAHLAGLLDGLIDAYHRSSSGQGRCGTPKHSTTFAIDEIVSFLPESDQAEAFEAISTFADQRASIALSKARQILEDAEHDLIAQAKTAPDDSGIRDDGININPSPASHVRPAVPPKGPPPAPMPRLQPERCDYSDAYEGAREDLLIWKRRALTHEQTIRELNQTIQQMGEALNAENGPTFMGEPLIIDSVQVSRDAVHKLFRAAGLSGSVPFDRVLISAAEKLNECGGVPDGYALVPTDPLKCLDMGFAYVDAATEAQPKKKWAFSIAGYKAMLAAAQEGK